MPETSSSIFPPDPKTFSELVSQIPGKYAVGGAIDRAGAAMITNRLRHFQEVTIEMLVEALQNKGVPKNDIEIIVEAYKMFVQ